MFCFRDINSTALCSVNVVLYPVKRVHMHVKGALVCKIPRHDRDLLLEVVTQALQGDGKPEKRAFLK